MAERLIDVEDVVGSSPAPPTKTILFGFCPNKLKREKKCYVLDGDFGL
jgi:hypothetical protein